MTASIIIPCHNAESYVAEAIESALAQGCEVVVVDDGSTDGTLAVVERYREQLTIITGENRGVSAARNTGARAATGDVLLFLDADDRLRQDALTGRLNLLKDTCAAVAGNARFMDAHLQQTLGYGRRIPEREQALQYRAIVRQNWGGACGMLVRKSAFWAVGGFDPNLQVSEDWDLLLRLAKFQIAYDDEPGVDVRTTGTSLTADPVRIYDGCRAVLAKNEAYTENRLRYRWDSWVSMFVTTVSLLKSHGNVGAFLLQRPGSTLYVVLWALRAGKNKLKKVFRRPPEHSSD